MAVEVLFLILVMLGLHFLERFSFYKGLFVEKAKHEYGNVIPAGTEPGQEKTIQYTVQEPLGVVACKAFTQVCKPESV